MDLSKSLTSSSSTNRIFLWIIRRSLSTALLKCISFIEGSQVWMEPYLCCFSNILASDPCYWATSPVTRNAKPISSQFKSKKVSDTKDQSLFRDGKLQPVSLFTYDWVQTQLDKPLEKGQKFMFVKDSALAIYGHYEKLPKIPFRHTFLIRHPHRIAVSLRRVYANIFHDGRNTDNIDLFTGNPNLEPSGDDSDAMLVLWNYVRANIDPNPVVIDADDLQNYPEIILKKYCQAVGIEYHERYLQWDSSEDFVRYLYGPQEQMIWGKDVRAYDKAFSSSCFMKNTTEIPKLECMPPDSQNYARKLLDGYHAMYETRIIPFEEKSVVLPGSCNLDK